ncbi:MAG TPA: thioredoxin family protein [Prolixibacteraceae bacterium]|nr:thioredoxin family protein [Prolixibacteraceae bacterium]
MKIILIIFLFGVFAAQAQLPVLKIGDSIPSPDVKMNCAVSGKVTDLESLKEQNGLLVIFSCNTCPFVIAWEDRYPLVAEIARENKIGFVLLNANHLKRVGDDSPEAMKEHAEKHNYQWPYLIDDKSIVANAFGAQTTPHVFLFDKNLKLVYKGAIDDNYKNKEDVSEFYVKDALVSLGKGKAIIKNETRNLGCSIKRP